MSESNPIKVFVTHTFSETDDYLRVFEFLEGVDRFFYINVSKPENIPASGGAESIREELIEQIKASEAILVLSGLYDEETELVRFMMDIATEHGKGMIAIHPFGGVSEAAPEVIERCQEFVGWNDRDIADAFLRQARGEDTKRWEALDFPGFDADGPTD